MLNLSAITSKIHNVTIFVIFNIKNALCETFRYIYHMSIHKINFYCY